MTANYEVFKGPRQEPNIVVATGNQHRLRAHAAYPARVENIDPEKDLGHTESDEKDAQAVAWDKTEKIRRELETWWPEGHSYVITANDAITYYGETLEQLLDPNQRRELLKLNRDFSQQTPPEALNALVERATIDAFEMYCECVNNQFFIMWELGTAVQIPSQNVSVTTGIKIIGCFNALPEEEVIQAFDSGIAFDIGPRVQLAELADMYAYDVYIESSDQRQALHYARLRNLVIEGVMPWSSFQRLLLESPGTSADKPYKHVPVPFI